MSEIPFRKDSDLEKLRDIIIGDDHDVVKDLKARLDDPDRRSQDVAAILPQAIQGIESSQDKIALGEALSRPLETAVKLSIKKDPGTFSDLLYPVILPSIRRAVNEMLRSFVERIDRAINQRFSLKALAWRFESLRTGIPYSEILMRHSVLYSVEQALLIHRETGLLIQHAYTESAKRTDSDAVSGMLIAIEKFVQDSFVENDEFLQRVTIGEHLVYLIDGPYAVLACVVRGAPPGTFVEDMREILESIHAAEPDKLKSFTGDRSELNVLRPQMDRSLQVAYRDEPSNEEKQKYKTVISIVGWLFAISLLFLLGYMGYNAIQKSQVKQYVIQLNQQPGVKILNHYKDKGFWHLEGLKAPEVSIIGLPDESIFLNQKHIQLGLAAFQGMDDSVILQRAKNLLAIPDTLTANKDGSVLKLSGTPSVSWYLDAIERSSLPDGISQLDLDGVTLDQEEVLAFLNQVLAAPVDVNSQLGEYEIIYSGTASIDWIDSLQALVALFEPRLAFNTTALQSIEQKRLLHLMQELGDKYLDFENDSTLKPESEKVLLQTAIILSEIERMAAILEKDYEVVVSGYTDEVGTNETNQTLRRDRAKFAMEKLGLYGVNQDRIVLAATETSSNRDKRQAGFTVRILPDSQQFSP